MPLLETVSLVIVLSLLFSQLWLLFPDLHYYIPQLISIFLLGYLITNFISRRIGKKQPAGSKTDTPVVDSDTVQPFFQDYLKPKLKTLRQLSQHPEINKQIIQRQIDLIEAVMHDYLEEDKRHDNI